MIFNCIEMDKESWKCSTSKGTPIKATKRDVKGLLSLAQEESPSQPDVLWSSYDSPLKNIRAVGGKSKPLKSSNQLTPRNHLTRKKYHSSPILVAKTYEKGKKEVSKESSVDESKRILEEFQRQLANENYVPRNLLENLSESLEDSIILPETSVNDCRTDRNDVNNLSDHDYEFTDQEDLDMLEEIEAEARRMLDKKLTLTNKLKDFVTENGPKTLRKSLTKDSKKPNVQNNYFDSDDDELIMSIPFEKLVEKPTVSSLPNQKVKIGPGGSHSSVIPVKRERPTSCTDTKTQTNNSKLVVQQSAATPVNSMNQEPVAKKRCTSEEIAEKRRQAMLRREAYLQNLKSTQK